MALDLSYLDEPEKAQGGVDLSYLDEPEVKKEPSVGSVEAFARGAAQGATFGFADELTGAGQAAIDFISDPSNQDIIEAYRKRRDESRAAYGAAEEAQPVASLAGNVTGGLASAFVPGIGAAGAGLKGALAAGAAGAAYGLGSGESDLTKGDVAGAAGDTALGATFGGVAHGAGRLLGKAFGYAKPGAITTGERMAQSAQGLERKAAAQTYKSIESRPTYTENVLNRGFSPSREGMTEAERLAEITSNIGKTANEEGISGITGGMKGMHERASLATKRAGEELGELHSALDSSGARVSAGKMFESADQLVKPKGIGSSLVEEEQNIVNTFKEELAGYSDQNWGLSYADSQKLYERLAENVRNFAKDPSKSVSDGTTRKLMGIVRQAQEDGINAAEQKTGVKFSDVRAARDRYHKLRTIEQDILLPKAASEYAGKGPGIFATTIAGQGMAVGGAAMGYAGGESDIGTIGKGMAGMGVILTAPKFIPMIQRANASKNYSLANMYKRMGQAYESMSPTARKSIDFALQRGEKAVIATDYILQQTDHNYNAERNKKGQ